MRVVRRATKLSTAQTFIMGYVFEWGAAILLKGLLVRFIRSLVDGLFQRKYPTFRIFPTTIETLKVPWVWSF